MRMITKYLASDGSEHLSEAEAIAHDAKLRGLLFKCPKCSGRGSVNGKPVTRQVPDDEATAWGGWFAPQQYKEVVVGCEVLPCDVCRGVGFTAQPVEAITETRVTGYRVK